MVLPCLVSLQLIRCLHHHHQIHLFLQQQNLHLLLIHLLHQHPKYIISMSDSIVFTPPQTFSSSDSSSSKSILPLPSSTYLTGTYLFLKYSMRHSYSLFSIPTNLWETAFFRINSKSNILLCIAEPIFILLFFTYINYNYSVEFNSG